MGTVLLEHGARKHEWFLVKSPVDSRAQYSVCVSQDRLGDAVMTNAPQLSGLEEQRFMSHLYVILRSAMVLPYALCPLPSWVQADGAASLWDTAAIRAEEKRTENFVLASTAHTIGQSKSNG